MGSRTAKPVETDLGTVGIRALQQNASKVVSRAKAGEIITITEHGKPVARIVPIAKDRYQEMIDAGRIIPATHSLRDLPPPLKIPGATLSDDIIRAREEVRY